MFVPKHIACGFCSSHDQFLNSASKAKCHSVNEKRKQECHFDKPKDHLQEGDALGLMCREEKEGGSDCGIGLQEGCSRARGSSLTPLVCSLSWSRERRGCY